MPLYLTELAPWERKNECYNNIKLGKDLKTQIKNISTATSAMMAAQMASAHSMIVSQERIKEKIDNAPYEIERVEQGIYGLRAAFEWGISDVVWQIEQNREALKSILEVFSASLETQGKEIRKKAEKAYANGWYDEALESFLESEKKDLYDFSIHISIGMIYLFNKIDKNKALEYFDKAIKYARPKSSYHEAFALLYKALIKRDLGLLKEAEQHAAEAIELYPDFAEAYFQNALFNAQLANAHQAIDSLEAAIRMDKNYCLKANDSVFNPIRDEVDQLIVTLKDETNKACAALIGKIVLTLKETNDLLKPYADYGKRSFSIKQYDFEFMEIEYLLKRNSYFDCLDAQSRLNALVSQIQQYADNAKQYLDAIHASLEHEIHASPQKAQNDLRKKRKTMSDNIGLMVFIWFLLVLLSGLWCYCNSHLQSGGQSDLPWFALAVSAFLGWFPAAAIPTFIGYVLYQAEDNSHVILQLTKKLDGVTQSQDTMNGILAQVKGIGEF